MTMARGRKSKAKPSAKASRVFDGDGLRATVAAIEEGMDAVNAAALDLKAVKKKARAEGYSLKALRRVIGEHRAKDARQVEEERAIEELYRQALDLTPMEEIMQAGGETADDGDGAAGGAPGRPAENGAGAALQ
jgi:uncharacterized protein (UPF0335 family)